MKSVFAVTASDNVPGRHQVQESSQPRVVNMTQASLPGRAARHVNREAYSSKTSKQVARSMRDGRERNTINELRPRIYCPDTPLPFNCEHCPLNTRSEQQRAKNTRTWKEGEDKYSCRKAGSGGRCGVFRCRCQVANGPESPNSDG